MHWTAIAFASTAPWGRLCGWKRRYAGINLYMPSQSTWSACNGRVQWASPHRNMLKETPWWIKCFISVQKQCQIWVFVIFLRLFIQPREHKYCLLKMKAPEYGTLGSVHYSCSFTCGTHCLPPVQVSLFSSSWYVLSFLVLQTIRYNKCDGCKSSGLF